MRPTVAIDTDEFLRQLRVHCSQYGVPADEDALVRCRSHLTVLVRWNRAMNLVGDLSLRSAVERHYGESLFLASQLPLGSYGIADIGSGAGFPGIGVGALNRTCEVTLIESRQKKAAFLSESTRGWRNCRVFGSVAREFSDCVSWVISRGVEWSLVLENAQRLEAGIAVLSSAEDSNRYRDVVAKLGCQSRTVPIPWRPEAAVFLAATVCEHA